MNSKILFIVFLILLTSSSYGYRTCSSDSDCYGYDYCSSGYCLPKDCDKDSDCPSNFYCKQQKGDDKCVLKSFNAYAPRILPSTLTSSCSTSYSCPTLSDGTHTWPKTLSFGGSTFTVCVDSAGNKYGTPKTINNCTKKESSSQEIKTVITAKVWRPVEASEDGTILVAVEETDPSLCPIDGLDATLDSSLIHFGGIVRQDSLSLLAVGIYGVYTPSFHGSSRVSVWVKDDSAISVNTSTGEYTVTGTSQIFGGTYDPSSINPRDPYNAFIQKVITDQSSNIISTSYLSYRFPRKTFETYGEFTLNLSIVPVAISFGAKKAEYVESLIAAPGKTVFDTPWKGSVFSWSESIWDRKPFSLYSYSFSSGNIIASTSPSLDFIADAERVKYSALVTDNLNLYFVRLSFNDIRYAEAARIYYMTEPSHSGYIEGLAQIPVPGSMIALAQIGYRQYIDIYQDSGGDIKVGFITVTNNGEGGFVLDHTAVGELPSRPQQVVQNSYAVFVLTEDARVFKITMPGNKTKIPDACGDGRYFPKYELVSDDSSSSDEGSTDDSSSDDSSSDDSSSDDGSGSSDDVGF